MRDFSSTPETRLFVAIGCAAFGLLCAVVIAAASFDSMVADFASPRRWLLLAVAFGLNYGVLALMARFAGTPAIAILAGFAVLVFVTLALDWRWAQVQVPLGFWIADVLGMAVAHGVSLFRAARRKAMRPDVQSSFLASRLWK